MHSVQQNAEWLRKVARCRCIKKRNKMIGEANNDQLLAIIECALNTLKSRVKFSNRQKQKLIPHAEYLRKRSQKRGVQQTRNFLQQGNGAILPALLLPIITQALSSLIFNKE